MKNILSILIIVVAIAIGACTNLKKESTTPPNILFIMSDDHTSQAWGIYGGILEDYAKNDNIKRIASEGAVLNNVFCTNSICVPSRASIMTGNYSHDNNVYTLNDSLKHDQVSVASLLQKMGYNTSIIGKWHLKEMPQGFDFVSVLPGQGRYNAPKFRNLNNWDDADEWTTEEGFSSDVIASKSIKWLANRSRDKPFFLMTHFKATHEPFDYPTRLEALYADVTLPEPGTLLEDTSRLFSGQQMEILGKRYEADSERDVSQQRYHGLPVKFSQNNAIQRRSDIYQKFIKDFLRSGAAIDENIGRLLDYLDKEDLAENTVVIYTSDQGYFLGEHGFFDKRIMYEEALKMPFVVRYPKEIEAGTKVNEMILNLDFPSLFLDYAEAKSSTFGKGSSFRHLLKGDDDAAWRKEMYYRYWQHLDIRPAHLGIRSEDKKLIYFYGKPLGMKGAMQAETKPFWEFYDLKNDPDENHNLINDSAYAAEISEMKHMLTKLKAEVGDSSLEIEK